MEKKLWWRCPKCGQRIEFEEQLVDELRLFESDTGEESCLRKISEGEVSDSPIYCENCGKSWYLYVSDMVPPKKPIAVIRGEYHGAPECKEDEPQTQNVMIYQVKANLEPYIREELIFSFYEFEFEQAEDGVCLCKTTCQPSHFWWLYLRSVCAKKTLEEGRLYVTYLESQDPLILKTLSHFYQMGKFKLLPRNEAPDFKLIDGKEATHTTSWYDVTVSIPEVLKHEFQIRGYQTQLFDAAEGSYIAVEDCPHNAFDQISDRAACIIKGLQEDFVYLTERESKNTELKKILSKRYHFTANLLL